MLLGANVFLNGISVKVVDEDCNLVDRAVLVIETLPLPVTLRYLETFLPPEPLYLLVIDLPAFSAE
jgi:hypothetical protein